MRIDVITIFPDYLAPLDASLLGKARSKGLLQVGVHDLRRWTDDVHRTVDDSPYGGGPGMVMRPEPWGRALDELLGPAGDEEADQTAAAADHTAVADQTADAQRPLLVVPTPSGVPFTQATAARYATRTHLVFACGRYEGIDSRVALDARARMDVEEVSIGDYVLAGGEVAVLVMVEAIARLLPGVLGNAASVVDDSFAAGAMAALLEGPVYTRPPSWRGHEVPAVLLSGDHGAIAAWRREQAVARTAQRRPDLMAPDPLADPVPDGDSERLRRPGVGHQPP